MEPNFANVIGLNWVPNWAKLDVFNGCKLAVEDRSELGAMDRSTLNHIGGDKIHPL